MGEAAAINRTIWWDQDDVVVLDQTQLPHTQRTVRWRTVADAAAGIATMQVRGAPLIGVAAAHGMALAMQRDPARLDPPHRQLAATRPTAVNLRWALDRVRRSLRDIGVDKRAAAARELAVTMTEEDVATCRRIAEAGLPLLQDLHDKHDRPVNVLTHCNAGWLACVEWGTATAPIYLAQQQGVPVPVWVSETRPRNQGASLTAWELGHRGVAHTVVVDNAAGHLLQQGLVDVVITGADRVAANGDAANKIGTYLKAVAAADTGVPFYIAAPASTFDPDCADGAAVPIEERATEEVLQFADRAIAPAETPARNWGFDVTPSKLITGYITDRGVLNGRELGAVLDVESLRG